MKKFLNLYYLLIALVLGIAMTIYTKTNRNQQTAPKPNDSVHGAITVDSSISSTSAQVLNAPSQMREVLKPHLAHETVLQFVARFRKWNEQDITEAIVELKSLSDDDKTRITDVYAQAFDDTWPPSEHHWKFLETCFEEYAGVCDRIDGFGYGCFSIPSAMAFHSLAKHRATQKSPNTKEWLERICKSAPKFIPFIELDQKLMADLDTTPNFRTAQQAQPQILPKFTIPYRQE